MFFDILILIRDFAIVFLEWNYKIGKFIVSTLCFIARSLYICAERLYNLIQIIVGDFELFFQDVKRQTSYILELMGEVLSFFTRKADQVISYFKGVLYVINFFLSTVYSSLEGAGRFITDTISQIVPTLTFIVRIPNVLFQSILYSIYDIRDIILRVIRDIFDCFKQVPVESSAGTFCLVGGVYILIKYRKFILTICRRILFLLYSYSSLVIYKFLLKRLHSRIFQRVPRINQVTKEEDENYLCVICQSSPRCIVLMPCKHLCLCNKCSNTLVRYQTNNCPVCRQETFFKIKVYL